MPSAAGLNSFVRTLCVAFGTSISTTAWDVRTSLHYARLTETASIYNPLFSGEMARIQSANLDAMQAYSALERMLSVQAGMLGANDVFWISSMLFMVLAAMVWLARSSPH